MTNNGWKWCDSKMYTHCDTELKSDKKNYFSEICVSLSLFQHNCCVTLWRFIKAKANSVTWHKSFNNCCANVTWVLWQLLHYMWYSSSTVALIPHKSLDKCRTAVIYMSHWYQSQMSFSIKCIISLCHKNSFQELRIFSFLCCMSKTFLQFSNQKKWLRF